MRRHAQNGRNFATIRSEPHAQSRRFALAPHVGPPHRSFDLDFLRADHENFASAAPDARAIVSNFRQRLWMQEKAERRRSFRERLDSITNDDLARPHRQTTDMDGAAGKVRETIVRSLEDEAVLCPIVESHVQIRSAATSKGAEKIGLIGILETKCVVIGGRACAPAFLARDIFEDTLIDEDALACDRPFETADVSMSVGRQIIWTDAAEIRDEIIRAIAQAEVAALRIGENALRRRSAAEQSRIDLETFTGFI
nr:MULTISPECIES: hypothetical protein [Methylosinus]